MIDGLALILGDTEGAAEGAVEQGHRQQVVVQISKAISYP